MVRWSKSVVPANTSTTITHAIEYIMYLKMMLILLLGFAYFIDFSVGEYCLSVFIVYSHYTISYCLFVYNTIELFFCSFAPFEHGEITEEFFIVLVFG